MFKWPLLSCDLGLSVVRIYVASLTWNMRSKSKETKVCLPLWGVAQLAKRLHHKLETLQRPKHLNMLNTSSVFQDSVNVGVPWALSPSALRSWSRSASLHPERTSNAAGSPQKAVCRPRFRPAGVAGAGYSKWLEAWRHRERLACFAHLWSV